MSVGLRTGSGVNFMAVLVPGIFFSKKQRGCDFVPQLLQPGVRGLLSLQPCWRWVSMLPSWMGERASRLPACLSPSEARLPWLAGGQSSSRVWKFSPFPVSSDTRAMFSVWHSENILFWLKKKWMENTSLK